MRHHIILLQVVAFHFSNAMLQEGEDESRPQNAVGTQSANLFPAPSNDNSESEVPSHPQQFPTKLDVQPPQESKRVLLSSAPTQGNPVGEYSMKLGHPALNQQANMDMYQPNINQPGYDDSSKNQHESNPATSPLKTPRFIGNMPIMNSAGSSYSGVYQPGPGQNSYGQTMPISSSYPGSNSYGQGRPGSHTYGQGVPSSSSYGQGLPGSNSYDQSVQIAKSYPGSNNVGQSAASSYGYSQNVQIAKSYPGSNNVGQSAASSYGYGQSVPGSYNYAQGAPSSSNSYGKSDPASYSAGQVAPASYNYNQAMPGTGGSPRSAFNSIDTNHDGLGSSGLSKDGLQNSMRFVDSASSLDHSENRFIKFINHLASFFGFKLCPL